MAMTLIREGGMQGDACSEGLLEPRLLTTAAPRVWHTGEEQDQVLGRLVLGVLRKPVARHCSDVCMWVFARTRGSVLTASRPRLCGERAGSKLLIFPVSPHFSQGRKLELLMRVMALPSVWSVMRVAIPFISVVGLLSVRLAGAGQDSGSVIPAESTYLPCAPVPSRCTPSCSALPPLNPQQPRRP